MISDVLLEDLKDICNELDKYNLKDSSILITGATGFIGSLVVKSLIYFNEVNKANNTIILNCRNSKKISDVYSGFNLDNVIVVENDVTESIEFNGEVDFVIHTASPTRSSFLASNPISTFEILYLGTKKVLEFSYEKRVKRFINISSMEVYGECAEENITESIQGFIDLETPRNSYPLGKRMSEFVTNMFYEKLSLDTVNVRLAQTFGAGILADEDRVFSQFSKSRISGVPIILKTEGSSVSTYCYSSDAIRAIFTLLLKGEAGQTYNISNIDTAMSIFDMAKLVAELNLEMSSVEVKILLDSNTLYPKQSTKIIDSSKMLALGWKPKYGLSEMYTRLIYDLIAKEIE